ncbi:hypothetical protein OEZ60_09215 [Defluviimonas sp. WL0024]|uniref:Uncharacterized protein n=1 Tax=Albidovulum salinarum TaxID=2984153 RepID=A0ABT2X8U9_9RHOB|nr:hypothetical protein [Defluviimonas sp. WL0024]MCU9848185.1 hypothetical protein [Defluviimonas sp. WL0024]
MVALYDKLSGASNVLVLSQESPKADMDGAASRTACFAGHRDAGSRAPFETPCGDVALPAGGANPEAAAG